MALLIADDVHERKIATLIPKGSRCYSACAYLFLAGIERQADGELGVHQISSDEPNLVSAQLSISDIIDVLNRFETPIQVLTVMFRTPPDDMHVFTAAEVEEFSINRRAGIAAPPTELVAGDAPEADEKSKDAPKPETAAATTLAHAAPSLDQASSSALSTIESYRRRPTRLAIFTGVDFYGEDLATTQASDIAACAAACLAKEGACKAFTYNANTKITRGPNCFLKSKRGMADGNAVAISGELLAASDNEPSGFSAGIIDPKIQVFSDVDLPFGDLARKPERRAATQGQCRLACVANDQCVGFTFVQRKKECWLKGSVGQPQSRAGMISGIKKLQAFAAPTIISLE